MIHLYWLKTSASAEIGYWGNIAQISVAIPVLKLLNSSSFESLPTFPQMLERESRQSFLSRMASCSFNPRYSAVVSVVCLFSHPAALKERGQACTQFHSLAIFLPLSLLPVSCLSSANRAGRPGPGLHFLFRFFLFFWWLDFTLLGSRRGFDAHDATVAQG